MFFGLNDLGKVKATKAQRKALVDQKRSAKVALASKRIDLRTAAKARAVDLLAQKAAAKAGAKSRAAALAAQKRENKDAARSRQMEVARAKADAKAAERLAKIRARAAQSVAQGSTPQAAAASAMTADAQEYPGEPLVSSGGGSMLSPYGVEYNQQQQMWSGSQEDLPAAQEEVEDVSGAWGTPAVQEDEYAWAVEAPAASPWEVMEYDPSVEEAAFAEMTDEGDWSDEETQAAAEAVEAEGALTPYPGQELTMETGEEDRIEYQELRPEPSAWGRGFFGMGAAVAAKRIAKRAGKVAASKGATPAQAAVVAQKIARRFFARRNFFCVKD